MKLFSDALVYGHVPIVCTLGNEINTKTERTQLNSLCAAKLQKLWPVDANKRNPVKLQGHTLAVFDSLRSEFVFERVWRLCREAAGWEKRSS